MATSVMRCTIPRLKRAHPRPQVAHPPLGDVLGQVRAPFELGQDQQQAHQVAQDPAAGSRSSSAHTDSSTAAVSSSTSWSPSTTAWATTGSWFNNA